MSRAAKKEYTCYAMDVPSYLARRGIRKKNCYVIKYFCELKLRNKKKLKWKEEEGKKCIKKYIRLHYVVNVFFYFYFFAR